MECRLPGPSVHGSLEARILEQVAISFSKGSSRPRDQTCVCCIGRQILYCTATRDVILFHCGEEVSCIRRKVGSCFGTVSGFCKVSPPDRRGPRTMTLRFPRGGGCGLSLRSSGLLTSKLLQPAPKGLLHPCSHAWPWLTLSHQFQVFRATSVDKMRISTPSHHINIMNMHLSSSSRVESLFEELDHPGASGASE